MLLVERDVFVAVADHAVHAQAGDSLQLAHLVPRDQRHHVHFTRLEQVDARGGVREEAEEQLPDFGILRATPVAFGALEQDVLARLPLLHPVWASAEWCAIVVVGGVEIAPLEHMLGQRAAHELELIGRVHLLVMHDGRERIGRIHRGDAVKAIDALGLPITLIDRIHGELHVGRRMRYAVVPLHARAELPRDIHATIGTHDHTAILRGRNFGREHGYDLHLPIVADEAFHHTRLNILENVRGITVHRVGLAIVAHDEQVI